MVYSNINGTVFYKENGHVDEYVYSVMNIFNTFWLYIAFFVIFICFMYFRQTKGSTKITGG